MSGTLDRPEVARDLTPVLRSLRELGRFDDAAALVRGADSARMSSHLHSAAGTALAAVSEYAQASTHLLLASPDPALAPSALARLAELAWIEHDYVRGEVFAIEGLAIDPSNRECREQLNRNQAGLSAPLEADRDRRPSGALAHAGSFPGPQGNAGELVLADALRRCFRADVGPGSWHDVHVHQLFDEHSLAQVNAADALIIGGGGLFLPDASPNGNSGWQWNIADDVLRRIDVPLVVFGVGYNMFEGQQFSGFGGGRFRHSLRTLVERSAFVGLRNHGSVNRVRELLPDHLAERVRWQPCPTTITRRVGGDVTDLARPDDPDQSGAVLLNCAFDRAGRRFGNGYGRFLSQLRDWVLSTRERAPVRYVAHSVDDEKFVVDLRREHGLTLPVIAMYDLTVPEIRAVYRRARLVVGMRGYAGLIPFGCGTPIISLITHPKLAYFLDDIDRSDWGISIRDPRLGGRLHELTVDLLDSRAEVVADIGRIQQRLHEVTTRNLRSLPATLRSGGRIGQDAKRE